MIEHKSIAEALVAFQANLPVVPKDSQGNRGKYADLADLTPVVVPALAEHGMYWSTQPTLNERGEFVLHYTLTHVSGGEIAGDWPLCDPASPSQSLGSAVTYGKRYALCAVTGVAPGGEDDDGAKATDNHKPQTQRRTAPTQRNGQERPAEEQAAHLVAKAKLRKACADAGWDMHKVADLFAGQHQAELGETTNAELIVAFTKQLYSLPDDQLKAKAAAQ